jgi:uncharacterized protein YjbI with pentapeptide repeats
MQGADLQGANLQGANLVGANLVDARLVCVDIEGADLHGAKGIYLLNIKDPRGYVAYAQLKDGVVMIGSGCRHLTVDNALVLWGETYTGLREIGDLYLAGIRELDSDEFGAWLESEIAQNIGEK